MNQTSLVIVFLSLGAGILLLVLLTLRWLPGWQKKAQQSANASLTPSRPVDAAIQASRDAVILVQPGGRVVYTNGTAQEWFGTQDQQPNLERLAKKARPPDVFLGLCVTEGQARFSLDGRLVEGSSYLVPFSPQMGAVIPQGRPITQPRESLFHASLAMLVTLRRPQVSFMEHGAAPAGEKNPTRLSGGASLQIFSELSQQMTANLELDKTLFAILESVERLISADFLEITRWDPAYNHLVPYRFVGVDENRRLEVAVERYSQDQTGQIPGYSGYLVTQRSLLVIGDVDAYRDVRPSVDRKKYPFNAYLGVPLVVAGNLVGTLELASLRRHAFGPGECEILRVLAGPAAIALNNALLFQAEQRRILEYSGLARLAKVGEEFFAAPNRDPNDLYGRLVNVIAGDPSGEASRLLAVRTLGFLIYHEQRHQLEAAPPFWGIPQQMLELYKVSLPLESLPEKIWLEQGRLASLDAQKDPVFVTLGLDRMAIAAGIMQTVLTPLIASGRKIGYLQAADKLDGSPFDEADLRLLEIIASQSAAILENAQLVHQSQQRAQRSEALRRIASLAASSATLDEILSFSLRELARLFRADTAVILLLDETLGELRLHRPSFFSPEWAQNFEPVRIVVSAEQVHKTVSGTGQAKIFNDLISEDGSGIDPSSSPDLAGAEFYRPIFEAFNIASALIAPLLMRDRCVGELMLGSDSPGFFDRSALTLTVTTASQLGSAVERFALYNQTDESLRRRVVQLLALTRISRELNTTLDLKHVLSLVYDEVLKTTLAHCGSIVLFERSSDPSKTTLAPAFALGEAVTELNELEKKVIQEAEPQIVPDFLEADFQAPHAGVRSALYVPVGFHGNVAGLISLHANKPGFFDQTALEIVQSLAVQAAIALANAVGYQDQMQRSEQLNRRVETLTYLLEASRCLSSSQPLEESLETIAYAIQNATPFGVVLISVFDAETQTLLRKSGAGLPLQTLAELKKTSQTWEAVHTLFQPEFRISQTYLIPFDRAQAIIKNLNLNVAQVLPALNILTAPSQQTWHPEDMCLVPLFSPSDNSPLGMISVDAPRDGQRPDMATIDALEIFASQAGFVIETYQKLRTLEARANDLENESHRSRMSADNTQTTLPTLLHKELEQTLVIHELTRRTRLERAVIEIGAVVNQQETRAKVLLALANGLMTGMELDVVLVAEMNQGSPRLLHALGNIPANVNPQALLGQRNPLRTVLQNGQPMFTSNIEDPALLPFAADQEQSSRVWRFSPLLMALDGRAFFCLPIQAGVTHTSGQVDAAVLGVSSAPLPPFGPEDEHLFVNLASQVSFTLQNLNLVEETNRNLLELNLVLEFSRQLSNLDAGNIVRTLVSSIQQLIPATHAAMAALWSDIDHRIVPQFAVGYPDNERIMQITYQAGEALVGRVFASGQPERISEVNFAQQYTLPAESVLLYRDATGGQLPVASLVVPLAIQAASKSSLERRSSVLGVLVLDNFKTPGAFSPADQALVVSLARQAALTLENVRLYQAAEARTTQLQALTRAAGAISSNLQVTDLTRSLLDQIQQILPFDTATLWLRGTGVIVREKPSESATTEIRRGWNTFTARAAQLRTPDGYVPRSESIGQSVSLSDSLLLREMAQTGQPVVVQDVRQDTRFPSLLEAQYLSWLSLPLFSQKEVVGVLVLEKIEPNYFSPDYVQVMVTFASQAAIALENASLYEDSQRRAQELDQRSRRLALLNRLSSALSESLDLEKIIQTACRELQFVVSGGLLTGELERAVSIILFDGQGRAFVRAEAPQRSERLPLLLDEADLFSRLRESQGVFSSQDVANEPELTNLQPYLQIFQTRSLLALPFISGANLLGLALLHAPTAYWFNPDEVELGRTIANQVAVALQNADLFAESARLFAETQRRSAELATLFDLGVNLTQVRDEQRLLDLTFEQVVKLLNPDAVLVSLLQQPNLLAVNIYEDGQRQPVFSVERTGASFSEKVITDNRPLLLEDTSAGETPVKGMRVGQRSCACWLGVPLVVRGAAIGVLSVQSYTPNQFSEADLHLVEQLANQLSVAIDNAQLFGEKELTATVLEQRVTERTDQLEREHHRIQTLLAITTELSASLDLDLVLTRTLGVINETIGAEHSAILLLQPDSPMLLLRASNGYMGSVGKGGRASNNRRNEGLAGWVIATRRAVLVEDVWNDPRWIPRDDGTRQHRSALAIPLLVGEDVLGVLMLYNRESRAFLEDQLELMQATAKQIAVAINNAQLYGLIRDQAERLGEMLRTQHIETSRSQAILEAVADGVLVTDSQRVITLFNFAAETILGLKRGDVVGRSLSHFSGLFGAAGFAWFETIQNWSEKPDSYSPGDNYAQQIWLDNGRVMEVSLSPVRLRNDFLGTVSIFRDITHQVEVDRLKSEFVATVSHELRTPMTSIKGYVEILLMGAAGQLSEQQTHFLQIVQQNTQRLSILVNDLLDVSRIEAGKVDLSLQPLDLRPLIDEAYAGVVRRLEDQHGRISFKHNLPANLPRVLGDRGRVLQMLDNLLTNAFQYTDEGGTVTIGMHQEGLEVQVDIQDTGIGIKPEDARRVFERFYRGSDPLVYAMPGNGLGLSIVKTMVEMHKGRIWFTSSGIPGEGSTFSFTLPVYQADGGS